MAQAKLKETASGAVLLEAEYRYLSDARTPQTWLGDTQRPISRALIDGINSIAQYITDEAFLLSKSSLAVLKRERPPGFLNSLAPLYPPGPGMVHVYRQGTLASPPRPFVQIDSLQPTLRWEAARPQSAPEQTQTANHPFVVYDLQVFQAREGKAFFEDGWFPGDLIIKRENLAEPRFEIEAPLKLCAKYFWTVRATWETRGRLTASEWMATYPYEQGPWQLRRNPAPTRPSPVPDRGMSGALANSFLPFQTPCDKPQPENHGRRFNPV